MYTSVSCSDAMGRKYGRRLAEYIGKEDVMVYSTGFGVNLGVVSALCGREDYILWDEQDHARFTPKPVE